MFRSVFVQRTAGAPRCSTITSVTAYFDRLSHGSFRATHEVQGAWNTAEQHIAPSIGLLAHLVEADHRARRDERLMLGRVSYDILGVLPIDVVDVEIEVVRAGRTIELVEATLRHGGRPAVILRAWFMQHTDTTAIAGGGLDPMPPLETHAHWNMGEVWPGAFVRSIDVQRSEERPGKVSAWIMPHLPLLDDEEVSATARALGLIDLANGLTQLVPVGSAFYPNVELTAHLFRVPDAGWIGLDTTVTFGAAGTGLTHSILNDAAGPFGVSMQGLTVRAR